MSQLEALETIARLRLLPDHVQHAVHQLGTFCVVPLGPVVASATLSEDEVVGAEDLTIGAAPNGVHGAWLEVHQHCPWNIFSPRGFVVVHFYPLQLQVRCFALERSRGVDSMLIADDLPELGTNLVATLTSLNVHNFPHGDGQEKRILLRSVIKLDSL